MESSEEAEFQCSVEVIGLFDKLITPEEWKRKRAIHRFFETFRKLHGYDTLHVGSTGEGLSKPSSTMKRDSDIDIMETDTSYIVSERLEIKNHSCNDLCTVLKLEKSKNYHPGYANLRLFLTDDYLHPNEFKEKLKDRDMTTLFSITTGRKTICTTTVHGPAITVTAKPSIFPFTDSQYEVKSLDFVLAVHCNEWPSEADEWLERTRFNWPSNNMITSVMQMGCDLVPTGVYGSSDTDTEWRISFVRAEIFLIHSMNPAQLKTVALLRIIFKNRVFGEDFHKKICSYVAKTAFFWVCEECDGSLWRKECFIKYLWLCLQKIMVFVKNGECPNYFMKNCNVLYGKLESFEKQIFSEKINIFLSNGCFIDKLTKLPGIGSPSDNVCPQDTKCSNGLLYKDFQRMISERATMEDFAESIFSNLSTASSESFMVVLKEIHFLLCDFPIFHKSRHTGFLQEFMVRCLLCTKLRIGNVLRHHIDENQNNRDNMIKNLLFKADVTMDRLCPSEVTQIAHVFFTNKFYGDVLCLVRKMFLAFKSNPCIRFNSNASIMKHDVGKLSDTSAFCPVYNITFFKLEESILPNELRLEIFVASVEHAENPKKQPFLFHVHIHPLVYACYMKYKCYKHLNDFKQSSIALKELQELILEDTVHQYHGLNLLGFCLCECRRFEDAMKIFALSYKERVFRKSVFYHTAIALRKCFRCINW